MQTENREWPKCQFKIGSGSNLPAEFLPVDSRHQYKAEILHLPVVIKSQFQYNEQPSIPT